MMRKGWVWGAMAVLVVGMALAAAGSLMAQAKPPADFTFDQGKDSPGKVTFSHEKHTAKNPKCTDCHVKIFKMKKGTTDTKGGSMHEEKSCGACHNGTASFSAKEKASCEKCHKK